MLLLVIIFVFDPLAVALVIAANFAFNQAYPKKKFKKNLYEEEVEVEGATLEEQAKYTNWENEANVFDEYSEEDEKGMDIIGQNGNDGIHYEENLDIEEEKKGTEKVYHDTRKPIH